MEWFYYNYKIPKCIKTQFNISADSKKLSELETWLYPDGHYDLFIKLNTVIQSSSFLTSLSSNPSLYNSYDMKDNPFKDYYHESYYFKKSLISSKISMCFNMFNIFKKKQIKVFEIFSEIQFSNSLALKDFREFNVDIALNDIYNCVELNCNVPRIPNPYLNKPFYYTFLNEYTNLKFKYKIYLR